MTTQRTISAPAFREFATQVLERVGLSAAHAADAIDVLVWASLRGVDTHGIRNLKRYYVDYLREGRMKMRPEFRIEYETPVSARVDGDEGIGLAAACWAMRLAIRKAAESGVGLVSMHNSHHLGAAGYYAHMAVGHDMIGVCLTGYLFAKGNDLGVLPVFGARPMLSTNPLSIAFPCAAEPPFVLDMATSVIPLNRVELIKDTGGSIPPGWGLDAEGRPTTAPEAIRQLLPLGGTPELGAHKGYGLATAVTVLSAVLSGGWGMTAADQPGEGAAYAQEREAHFFGAFRLDLFQSPEEFKRALDAMLRALKASPPVAGRERVYVAGDIEHETEQQRRRTGIPLTDRLVAELRDLSETYSVPLELPAEG